MSSPLTPRSTIVCVIGVPDDIWGEAVKAVVVLKEGAEGRGTGID